MKKFQAFDFELAGVDDAILFIFDGRLSEIEAHIARLKPEIRTGTTTGTPECFGKYVKRFYVYK